MGITAVDIDRELVRRRGLSAFIRLAWPHVSSDPYVHNWHIDGMAAHLEAVTRWDLTRLIINVPPGMTKSMTTSVLWPAYDWIQDAGQRHMFGAVDPELVQDFARKTRSLIQGEWFQERWGDRVQIMDSSQRGNSSLRYYTTAFGERNSLSIGQNPTGRHTNKQVFDDPVSAKDMAKGGAYAKRALETANRWWKGPMASRKLTRFARVGIMQRLDERDLAEQCIKEGYTLYRLPMEFELETACVTPFAKDIRTQAGELLFSARFPRADVDKLKSEITDLEWAAQYQQRPAPANGAVFLKSWGWTTRYWDHVPIGAEYVLSVDCAFKDEPASDYVVLALWARYQGKYYLVDLYRERLDIGGTILAIKSFYDKYPDIHYTLVEDKANGPAVISTLRKEAQEAGEGSVAHRIRLQAFEPGGDSKFARATSASIEFREARVFLPNPAGRPWVKEYIDELVSFPRGANDDQVDATSQILIRWSARGRKKTSGGEGWTT